MAYAYTEFYCNSSGADINAGSSTGAALVTSTNGDWGNAAANRFTAAAGTPFSGVSVGDWASVYNDGATQAVYIARVTAVNGGGASIDLSSTAIGGVAPVSGASGKSCTVNGAWLTPTPAILAKSTMTNTTGNPPRVNFKGTFNVTAVTAFVQPGVTYQGYTTTAGDGGRATVDGGVAGASFVLFSFSSAAIGAVLRDMIFQNNGASTANAGLTFAADRILVERVTVTAVRGGGFSSSTVVVFRECEAYACNQSNTATTGGFVATGGCIYIRCYSHDNTGSNSNGFVGSNAAFTLYYIECIADTNTLYGFFCNTRNGCVLQNCISYGNGGDGIRFTNASAVLTGIAENCILVKNGGYGINIVETTSVIMLRKNGYGGATGSNNNSSGQTNAGINAQEEGAISFSGSPFNDAANADFTLTDAAAKATGRGSFTLNTGTALSYRDLGAVQSQASSSTTGAARLVNGGVVN